MPRFYCPGSLSPGAVQLLPGGAARHVQVLRLQPGAEITLFNGEGGQFAARVLRMGRSEVEVEIGLHEPVEREVARALHLAIGMPANERMDWLVEKATELGVASIWPLLAERTVVRLSGERADKKQAHWQGIAIAACEQCGRNRVPMVHAPQPLSSWLAHWPTHAPTLGQPLLLSLKKGVQPLRVHAMHDGPVLFLSGPEGGLSPGEEEAALRQGFTPCTLGPRILRAETAALAALATLQD